jgi:hypothetical protein
LALLTLYAESQSDFKDTTCPDWVSEWLDTRDNRKEKKAERDANPKEVDKKAQAKRQEQRADKVTQGIQDLSRWMQDIAQIGFSELPNKPFSYWEGVASRLVDAQATGLATRVRELGSIAASGKEVMPRLTEAFGQLFLLIEGYSNQQNLPINLQADVRQCIGWSYTQDELRATPPVDDDWLVLAVQQSIDAKLIAQFSWLLGVNTGKPACVIQFAHATQRASLSLGWRSGTRIRGNLHFYPSATPLRAIVGDSTVIQPEATSNSGLSRFNSPETMLENFVSMRNQNPWLEQFLFTLSQVRFVKVDGAMVLIGEKNSSLGLPVNPKMCDQWLLLAISAGRAVNAAVIWDGEMVMPIAIWQDEQVVSVLSRESIA